VKVGDLVTGANKYDPFVGIIIAPSVAGLWLVLIESVVHELLERELEVVSESR